jgi:site-specific DNA-methyltransferase (cytosine-N4-specific)
MSLYYQDETITLHQGDSLDVARTLNSGSVDCIVTSPPYYGLRDYGNEGQYGLEESPAAYVETMRALFSELRRVLADDGTLWLNIGDSYYSGRGNPGPNSADSKQGARRGWPRALDKPGQPWGQKKGLLGIPWRVAFALQDDGWILRNSIIWHKLNAMPESVTDRLSGRHENLFMFSKGQKYWFDLDPIRTEHAESTVAAASRARIPYAAPEQRPNTKTRAMHKQGANPGDVWSINTQPFGGAHFAVMPQELARRAIVAGCKPSGTVLDPFSGSGTTGLVAQNNGRKYVGIDISADYLKLSLETRLRNAALDFGGAA